MWLDLGLALAILFGLVFALMAVWGAWRGAMQVIEHGPAIAQDQQGMLAAIGEPPAALLLLASGIGSLAAALLLYFLRRPASLAERIHSRAAIRQPRVWLESLGLGLTMFLASTGLMWLLDRFAHVPEPSNLRLLEETVATSPWLLLVFVVVLAPFAEELLFRRVLFGRLWAAGKPLIGMWLTGVVFALMHEIPGTGNNPWYASLILLLFYTMMGAGFAWIYRRHGTLWAAILAHASNNALAGVVLIAGG